MFVSLLRHIDSVPYSTEKLMVSLTLCAEIQGSFCEIQESSMKITEMDQPQSFEFTQIHLFNMHTCAEKKEYTVDLLKKKKKIS